MKIKEMMEERLQEIEPFINEISNKIDDLTKELDELSLEKDAIHKCIVVFDSPHESKDELDTLDKKPGDRIKPNTPRVRKTIVAILSRVSGATNREILLSLDKNFKLYVPEGSLTHHLHWLRDNGFIFKGGSHWHLSEDARQQDEE
jgi:hypothetical protein